MPHSRPRLSPVVHRPFVAGAAALSVLAGSGGFAAGADASGGAEPAGGSGSAVEVTRDLRYRGAGGPRLDVYRPVSAAGPAAGVLVVHGGAWQYGTRRRTSGVARALARFGFVAFNVDYTLASARRPGLRTQPEELRAAVRWIRRHAGRFGVAPRRVGALGTSAGGNLVGLLATDAEGPLETGDRIRAAVTWSAPFALRRLGPGWLDGAIAAFTGCADPACGDRLLAGSPTSHVTSDDPPFLIVNSRREVVPAGQAHAMTGRLRAAGVPHRLRMLDGMSHGMDYARAMTRASALFLRRALAPRG